jgi:hypothetical protein
MPTRADAETVLIARTRPMIMALEAGLQGTAGEPYRLFDLAGPSPIAALDDPIAVGLSACGVPAAGPVSPTDDDVTALGTGRQWMMFLDIAELRVLETAGFAVALKPTMNQFQGHLIQRNMAAFRTALNDKREAVRRTWGYGAPALSTGTLDLGGRSRWPEF